MPVSNAVVLENQKQGNPQSDWGLTFGGPVGNIEGYAKELSVNVGGTVEFKINTDATDYRIDIYRLGYYNGDGARLVGTVDPGITSANQPAPLKDASTGLVDAGNWFVTDTWQMPDDLISGVYLAKLVREDGTFGESRIPFIVRDDASTSDIIFQTSDTTWQAYNPWGGNSLYTGHETGSFHKAVSYNRPMALDIAEPTGTTLYGPESYLFGAEYAAIRWLESNGYDVSYQTGIDTARFGDSLLNHEVFLSVGHDEYWSGEQRANVEAARDAGVNLSFWSGNTMFWKTRHDVGITGDSWKTLVTYKESYDGAPSDPSNIWTGLWRDADGLSEGGGVPESALKGSNFAVNLGTPLTTIDIPHAICGCLLWANTDVANLQPGETWTLNGNYLGYEWDVDVLDDFRPDNLIALSETTVEVPFLLEGTNVQYSQGTATHNMTMYRADSGALVFSAGTVFWSWALDDFHVFGPVGPYEPTPTDPNAQQAMVNLFAEMGVQPETLSYWLVPGEKSTDFYAPSSQIENVYNGISFGAGSTVTLTGTAEDTGGVVAGLEISTDGGANWEPATVYHPLIGGKTWSYIWNVPETLGPVSVLTRAIDDTLNAETPDKVLKVNIVDPFAEVEIGTPVSRVTNYIDANVVTSETLVTITGAAVDPDGGFIGGVEVSFDNGNSWVLANDSIGTNSWNIEWYSPPDPGLYTLLYRSGDLDGNLENANSIALWVADPTQVDLGGLPSSSVANLTNGQVLDIGTPITLTGTASDPDGFVGGVEVSIDGGYIWTTATGTDNWTFDWSLPDTPGAYTFQYRAGDNEGKTEAANTVLVNVVDPSEVPDPVPEPDAFPVSTITNFSGGNLVGSETLVTISGAAIDTDGLIGGVEVSFDGGNTWTLASDSIGSTDWSIDWYTPKDPGLSTIMYRAGDFDSNLEAANGIALNVVDPAELLVGGVAAPESTVTNLAPVETLEAGSSLTVTGTAVDPDGFIGGVEVSTDGGLTWTLANGAENWSYDYEVPNAPGVYSLSYRAGDSDFNLEAVNSILINVVDPFVVA